jgi:hypothetical protein
VKATQARVNSIKFGERDVAGNRCGTSRFPAHGTGSRYWSYVFKLLETRLDKQLDFDLLEKALEVVAAGTAPQSSGDKSKKRSERESTEIMRAKAYAVFEEKLRTESIKLPNLRPDTDIFEHLLSAARDDRTVQQLFAQDWPQWSNQPGHTFGKELTLRPASYTQHLAEWLHAANESVSASPKTPNTSEHHPDNGDQRPQSVDEEPAGRRTFQPEPTALGFTFRGNAEAVGEEHPLPELRKGLLRIHTAQHSSHPALAGTTAAKYRRNPDLEWQGRETSVKSVTSADTEGNFREPAADTEAWITAQDIEEYTAEVAQSERDKEVEGDSGDGDFGPRKDSEPGSNLSRGASAASDEDLVHEQTASVESHGY